MKVGQASVQNSATATFLQGAHSAREKINPKIIPCHSIVIKIQCHCARTEQPFSFLLRYEGKNGQDEKMTENG
jgi:hypothetical protein